MPQSVFSRDTYTTVSDMKKTPLKYFFSSRAYFVPRLIQIVVRYGSIARTSGFDFEVWHQAASTVFHLIEQCGGRFTITGLGNLQATQSPVVIIANHMSSMETFILPAFVYPHKRTVYVIKEQLRKVPFFAHCVKECITVSRKNPAEDFKQVMKQGVDMLGRDRSVIIFPQAKRSTVFDPAHFNTLGVKLARKAGVPVIPLALRTDFWGTGKIIKDFGPLNPARTIHFEFGQPISIAGSGKEEHAQIVRFIQERLERWRSAGGLED